MPDKLPKEWFLNVPWGKMAMLSWGAASLPPLLLVHGFLDSAATFLSLVAAMPASYHYVTFDLPGHGRSDTMPGPPLSYMHLVEAVRQIVEQQHWNTFHCIAHSMGFLICVFYNAAFPGRIRRLVSLAGFMSIPFHGLVEHHDKWFELCYVNYYRRYCLPSQPVTYTHEEALRSLAAARHLTEEQAAVLATRCFARSLDGRVKLTWDVQAKRIIVAPVSADMIYAAISCATPTLCLTPTEDETPVAFAEYHDNMSARLTTLATLSERFLLVDVKGGHSVHLTNPERIVPHIVRFLNVDSKSKL